MVESAIPDILWEPQIAQLIAVAEPLRGERAMVQVFIGAGLRESELCALDCEDIRELPDGVWALRVRGKRKKQRLVPLGAAALEAVRAYLAATGRAPGAAGPLFLARDLGAHRRLAARGVRKRVQTLVGKAGLSGNLHAHSLRHTFAMEVLRQGGQLHVLKRLGHASLATTQRYVDHLDLSDLVDAVPTIGG
jgi:site-specific recombinase XerD